MECNKEEAVRAKEVAEKKFKARDIVGALKFAVKAQKLYPELEGISQMLATLDVYVAAESKVNGGTNRYEILGVNPLADEDTVRKQYRKLALLLHPDKNKSVGAEGAFKLVSEAWSFLSDKTKKFAYDQRNETAFRQGAHPPSVDPSPPSVQNGFYDFATSKASHGKVPKQNFPKTGSSSGVASSSKKKNRTFWTVCHRCRMQYEYLRMYLNQNLLCPNCHVAFFAVEISPPSSNGFSRSSQSNYSQQQQCLNKHGTSRPIPNSGRKNFTSTSYAGSAGSNGDHYDFQWVPFSKSTGAASVVQAANMVQQAYEKVKSERREAQAATKREEALKTKHRGSKRSRFPSSGKLDPVKRRKASESFGTGRNSMTWVSSETGISGSTISASKSHNKGASHINSKQLLMEKARKEIHEKFKSGIASQDMNDNKERKKQQIETINGATIGARWDHNKSCEVVNVENEVAADGLSCGFVKTDSAMLMSVDVPDSDFHNFDRDRTDKCFKTNHVWAAYDADDGMPRRYAMIHDVISLHPVKMRISWLKSETYGKLGSFYSVSYSLSRTCGDYRVGRPEIISSIYCFSHKVRWTSGVGGAIKIYPTKGEVWALYRNWSPDWNELTEEEVVRKYDMVEVLEDYDEEVGVLVIPLVKVAGFKSIFHQHLSMMEIRQIAKEELGRFSHHVPSYRITGQEASDAPKGSVELDPAATPLELLQVIEDINAYEHWTDEMVHDAGTACSNQRNENSFPTKEATSGNIGGANGATSFVIRLEGMQENSIDISGENSERKKKASFTEVEELLGSGGNKGMVQV